MASHVKIDVAIQSATDAEQVCHAEVTIRTDLLTMEPSRRRDAAVAITMHRVSEAFWAAYSAACAESSST